MDQAFLSRPETGTRLAFLDKVLNILMPFACTRRNTRTVKTPALAILVAALLGLLAGCAQYSEPASTAVAPPEQPASAGQDLDAPGKDDLAEQVARMGAIGYAARRCFLAGR